MDIDWKDLERIAHKLVIVAVICGAAALCVWLFPKALLLTLPFIIAYIISAIASPVTRFFKRLHFPPQVGAVISLLLVAAVVFGGLSAVIYKLSVEAYGFLESVPTVYHTAAKAIDKFADWFRSLPFPFDNIDLFDDIGDSLGNLLLSASSSLVESLPNLTARSAQTVASFFVGIIFTILASFFMLLDRDGVKCMVYNFLPPSVSQGISRVKSDVGSALWGYIRAQLILMAITFTELLIGLSVLSVRYSFLFAILIAILDAIPVFGTGTVLLPWAAISLLNGQYKTALGLLIIYAVCFVVRQLLEPKIISSQIGVNPIVTLFAMYIGLRLIGVLGMILGPVVCIIMKNALVRTKEPPAENE